MRLPFQTCTRFWYILSLYNLSLVVQPGKHYLDGSPRRSELETPPTQSDPALYCNVSNLSIKTQTSGTGSFLMITS
jgi:hypothetical protein